MPAFLRNTHGWQSTPVNENEGGNINCLAAFPTLDHQIFDTINA